MFYPGQDKLSKEKDQMENELPGNFKDKQFPVEKCILQHTAVNSTISCFPQREKQYIFKR